MVPLRDEEVIELLGRVWRKCTRQRDCEVDTIRQTIDQCDTNSQLLMSRVFGWVADANHDHFIANYLGWQQTSNSIDSRAFARPMNAEEHELRNLARASLSRQQVALRYAIAVLSAIEDLRKYPTVEARALTKKYLRKSLDEALRPAADKAQQFDPTLGSLNLVWLEL